MGRKEPSTLFAELLLLCFHLVCQLIIWARCGRSIGPCCLLTHRRCGFRMLDTDSISIVTLFARTTLTANFDRLANLAGDTMAALISRYSLADEFVVEVCARFE